ncbi:hypothetical protein OpiT1DRAFT_04001 [Opitutaceae bacterium TAV1]|nr:hypothetical protein OpiT1DRAFT_04001 [Opitutaceae bacterium TAV1]
MISDKIAEVRTQASVVVEELGCLLAHLTTISEIQRNAASPPGDARNIASEAEQAMEGSDTLAEEVSALCGKLYALERLARENLKEQERRAKP